MNILIPHKWLLEHLDTNASPQKIQESLSLCGPSIERIETIKGEPVYDIEVTTNRVDMMSVYGIAREASAIFPEFDIKADLIPLKDRLNQPVSKKPLDIEIKNDPKLCKRILAIKLSVKKVDDSPKWLRDRLEQVGQRPLNSLIDITNYTMWEIGHPIHVFDYDKLNQKKIIVRKAKKGENLTTLDNKTYTLEGGEVVFDDGTGTIIDLPGIMGTKNSVVSKDTKNILLWIEDVPSTLIRFASMTHAIRTQAAVLNEKHVDPNLGETAIKRAISLYQQVCDAKVESQLLDIYPKSTKPQVITVNQDQIDTYLGLHIKPTRVTRILKNLGFKVEPVGDRYQVTPPSFRSRDVTIYQDVIEEIARIYGYHNLPSVIMDTIIPDNPSNENFSLEYKIKTYLAGMGAHEIYTYSMISESLALQSTYELEDHLKIKNPLTDDMVYMRRSLIPSLIQVLTQNSQEKLTIFEMQNVYHKKSGSNLPNEELQLVIATNQKYTHLKGILDLLHQKLHISEPSFTPKDIQDEPLSPKSSGEIMSQNKHLGVVGGVKNSNIYVAKYSISDLQKLSKTHPTYIPIKNTAPIIEDLTFTLKPQTLIGEVINTIKDISSLIETVELKDVYKQNHTFTITYRHKSNPLSDKDIAPIRKKIVSSLNKSHQTNLVGSLK